MQSIRKHTNQRHHTCPSISKHHIPKQSNHFTTFLTPLDNKLRASSSVTFPPFKSWRPTILNTSLQPTSSSSVSEPIFQSTHSSPRLRPMLIIPIWALDELCSSRNSFRSLYAEYVVRDEPMTSRWDASLTNLSLRAFVSGSSDSPKKVTCSFHEERYQHITKKNPPLLYGICWEVDRFLCCCLFWCVWWVGGRWAWKTLPKVLRLLSHTLDMKVRQKCHRTDLVNPHPHLG